MKRIIALLLICCMIPALYACTEDPGSATDPVTGSETVTDAETETKTTDATEKITETDTEKTTETETDAATDTEPVKDNVKTYDVFDPMFNGYEFKGTLKLYENGKYVTEAAYTEADSVMNVYNVIVEQGTYRSGGSGADCELTAERLSVLITFDNSENKEAFLQKIKNDYLTGMYDGATYEIIKKAANGGYSGGLKELSESSLYGGMAETVTKVVFDKEENKAYYLTDLTLSENEYYIPESGYMLVLHSDGSCRMYYEDVFEDENGFGPSVISDVYEGTYTQDGDKISCAININTVKRSFPDAAAENSYKEYYEDQYSKGLLGKVYYDYYMALISGSGYTDDDLSDMYILELEEHTHTARILESPKTEG